MPKPSSALVEDRPAPAVSESPIIGFGLAQALDVFNLIIDRRTSVPVLECVRLVADGQTLTISGTDLDHQLTCKLPYSGVPFATCVPSHQLAAAAQSFGQEVVGFASAPDQFSLRGAAGDFQIRALAAGDYHELVRHDPVATFDVDRNPLLSAIAACRAGISREEARYYLNGLCLTHKPGKIEVTSTDGHRLHQKSVPLAAEDGAMPQVIIHHRAIRCLLKLLEENVASDVVAEVSARSAIFAIGDWTLQTKCIDGTYPDYTRVIPDKHGGSLTLQIDELADCLKSIGRLRIGDIKAAAITLPQPVMTFRDPDHGLTFTRSLTGQVTGDVPPAFGFNARYFQDILATHNGGEVTIHFPDVTGSAPMLIKFAGDVDFLAVLMPMRA